MHLWRRAASEGRYEYRATGSLAGVTPALCQQVYGDLAYRKQWDGALRRCGPVPDLPGGLHWVAKFPWPLADRDYVFSRTARARSTPHGDLFVTVSYSAPARSHPPTRDAVRVLDYRHTVVFAPVPVAAPTAGAAARTRIYVAYYEDPGAALPSAVLTAAIHAAVPTFVRDFVQGTPGRACARAVPPRQADRSGRPAGTRGQPAGTTAPTRTCWPRAWARRPRTRSRPRWRTASPRRSPAFSRCRPSRARELYRELWSVVYTPGARCLSRPRPRGRASPR